MKFYHKQKPRRDDADGATRTIRKFLIFPITIGDLTRWLEIASIDQEYNYMYATEYKVVYGWENKSWSDM